MRSEADRFPNRGSVEIVVMDRRSDANKLVLEAKMSLQSERKPDSTKHVPRWWWDILNLRNLH